MKPCPAYDLQFNISLPIRHIKTSPTFCLTYPIQNTIMKHLPSIWPPTQHIPACPTYHNISQHTTPYLTYPLQIAIMKSCPAYDLQLYISISLPVLRIRTSPNILHLVQHFNSRTPLWNLCPCSSNSKYSCLSDISKLPPQHTTPYSTYPIQNAVMKPLPSIWPPTKHSPAWSTYQNLPNILHLIQHILSRSTLWNPAQHMTSNSTDPCMSDI